MKVKDIMTRQKLHYCRPETRLYNAAKLMKAANCGALPVLDDRGQIVGMVTDRDICLSLADKKNGELSRVTIGDIMSARVATVAATDDLTVALREMRTKKVSRLPVVDEQQRLKGMISLHNILAKPAVSKKENGANMHLLKTIKALAAGYVKKNGKAAKTKVSVARVTSDPE